MEFRAKEIGMRAENRVYDLANKQGREVRKAEPKEDYSEKTDLIIDGTRIQVSCQPKSKAQRKALDKKGITPIVAGKGISDERLREQLSKIK